MIWVASMLVGLAAIILFYGVYLTFVRKEIDFTRLYPGYEIARRHLSVIERDIANLSEVVIVSDIVEKPNLLLLDAVRDNLLERINYFFYISERHSDRSKVEIKPFFESVKHTLTLTNPELELGNVTITSTGFDWNKDHPYIFYLYEEEGSSRRKVLAFRGTSTGVGVSESYVMIEPQVARTILNQIRGYAEAHTKDAQWISEQDLEFEDKIGKNVVKSRGYGNVIPIQ